MFIPTAPKFIRNAVRRGVIAGYRGMGPKEARARGHWFYMGWLDGSRLRGLTPYGVRRYIIETK